MEQLGIDILYIYLVLVPHCSLPYLYNTQGHCSRLAGPTVRVLQSFLFHLCPHRFLFPFSFPEDTDRQFHRVSRFALQRDETVSCHLNAHLSPSLFSPSLRKTPIPPAFVNHHFPIYVCASLSSTSCLATEMITSPTMASSLSFHIHNNLGHILLSWTFAP